MENKKFFVKDFIQYCSPCFGCDHLMNFRFGFQDKGAAQRTWSGSHWTDTAQAIITDKYIEVELSIRYRTNLKLWIFHRNHRVVSSDNDSFLDYLSKRDLFLTCQCGVCQSKIVSKDLDFDIVNNVLKPPSLRYEEFNISVKNKRYTLESNFDDQKSVGTIRTYTSHNISGPDLVFEMKLLPKYKLVTKQKLIDKLNIYAVFS